MIDKRKNNGGHSTAGKAGRQSVRDELKGVDLASPHVEESFKVIASIMQSDNENARDRITAAKLLIEYGCGKPKETIENINKNYDAGKLTEEEAKMLVNVLNEKY